MTEQDDTGSISQQRSRDGRTRWRVRLHVEGERRSYGLFDTRDEAEEALSAALELRGARASGTTLRAWGEAWLDRREKARRVRGIDKERSCWRAHIAKSELATLPLTRIRRHHVVGWLEVLAERTPRLSRQTIAHARRLVIGALEAALDGGRVHGNPARGARIPVRDETTEERWTWLRVDELARLFALPVHDPDHRGASGGRRPGTITTAQHSAIVVALYTGLRAGELWGLQWRDVVLNDGRPRVVVRHSRELAPKSGKIREVPLLAPAKAALERWREVAPGVGAALVWPAHDGQCHRDGYDAGWTRVKKLAAGDRRVRFHDLRHTCASHLVQGTWGRAWSLAEVRDVLGHSTIRQTERYAHLCPGGLHDAARATHGALPAGQLLDNVVSLNARTADEKAQK